MSGAKISEGRSLSPPGLSDVRKHLSPPQWHRLPVDDFFQDRQTRADL